ncbi:hypothetical protein H0H92_000751 [Tricholoma furcatifolium]|nr:hypothetical protein H0H92_000751 [Tricholoma furcatifolium]
MPDMDFVGHIKIMCALACRLVIETESTVVTLLTTSHLFERCRFEIERQFDKDHASSAHQRIQLLSIVESTTSDPTTTFEIIGQTYAPVYACLIQGKPVTCATTGRVFEAAPVLNAVIMDFFCIAQLKTTRAMTPNMSLVTWIPGGVGTVLRFWGPEAMGGIGDLTEKIQAEASRSGRSAFEVAEELYRPKNGDPVRVPGVPAVYDYEYRPQKLHYDIPLSMTVDYGRELIQESNAMLISSPEVYAKETLGAIKTWQSEQGKPVYFVGPLVSQPNAQSDLTKDNSDIATFLDKALEQHGKHSVVSWGKVAFGTTDWPTRPEYLDEVIEALLEKNIPFIVGHASPFAQIAPELSEKVKASGIGLLTPWCPQQFVLSHPATGWFVSHCGHGSITEALFNGVPLICWPFELDQAPAAANIADNLRVGFELFEVRTGPGLKPSYRTGQAPLGTRAGVGEEIRRVLDACRSEEGNQIRQNAKKLQEEFHAVWEEGGASKAALGEFLRRYANVQ